VRDHRPHPTEEFNSGPETTPRVAASVIVLRDSDAGPEVLLVQRNPEARFMGGAWVFPGGAVSGEESPARAGIRELEEEAAVVLAGGEGDLAAFSRWITPAEVKVRFDTFFYVAEAPAEARPVVDGAECVDFTWMRPADALAAYQRGDLLLVFPTIKHLEQLAELPSVAAAIELARSREVKPVQPRIIADADGGGRVLLPGEAGFDR
jgi:8-oxo-dGTP pyrophosphatase MutT (NUDIX family)